MLFKCTSEDYTIGMDTIAHVHDENDKPLGCDEEAYTNDDKGTQELLDLTKGIIPYTPKTLLTHKCETCEDRAKQIPTDLPTRVYEKWADVAAKHATKSWADMEDELEPNPPVQRMAAAALQPPSYYVPKRTNIVRKLMVNEMSPHPQDEWVHVKTAGLNPIVSKKRDLHRVLNSFQFKDWQANSLHISDSFKDPRFFKLTQYIDGISDDVISLKQIRATIEDVNSPISPACRASFEKLQVILNLIADRIARTLAVEVD